MARAGFCRLAVTGTVLMLTGLPLGAQQAPTGQTPLSVIDWLGQAPTAEKAKAPRARKPANRPAHNDPPVTKSASAPQVTVSELGSDAPPAAVGLVPFTVTGLPTDLWVASDVATIRQRLNALKHPDLPATQALLYSVLLTETLPPKGGGVAQDALSLLRVQTLRDLGALDPALALLTQAGATASAEHLALLMDLGLLTGTEDATCETLLGAGRLARDYGMRAFCTGRAGKWQDAALLIDSARALGLIPPLTADLLDRFLDPDAFEDAPPLPRPHPMTPLAFRLLETIGEPFPTGNLPRAYAYADLRDITGWKARLEAAERLARNGALPDNKLLGIYTHRLPSASGGIWDRVEALQRFETALNTRSPTAVAKTLPPAWAAMTQARLEIAFASLFADRLQGLPLTGRAQQIARQTGLLSVAYETIDTAPLPEGALLRAVATGDTGEISTRGGPATAIATAFSTAEPRGELTDLAAQGQLGVAILQTLEMLEDGVGGDNRALRDALATLRALGLEDTARRAALQVLLLERPPT